MLVHKAYKFRLYPTDQQWVLLAKTVGLCRLVYNLALEQRRTFSRRGRPVGYHAAAHDLKALKTEFPFVTEAPSQCLQQALIDLNQAFENFFKGIAKYPKPRKKFENDSCRFPQGFTVSRHRIKLPKLGNVRMAAHRTVKGTPKSLTVSREGDHWYASIACELEVAAPVVRPRREGGVDLNVATGAVTSEGLILPMPRLSPEEMRRRARLHKSLARKQKGSRNRLKARRTLARFEARLARRRRNAAHQISRRLANAHTHIAFEKLNVTNMTASARGTLESPGTNVAQKAGLNRAILDVSPGMIRRFTKYKAVWLGGECIEVPAGYTSQRCSECGKHPKDDASTKHLEHGRVSRDRFACPLCGYTAHADVNAARNILALGRQHWAAQDFADGRSVPACGGLRARRADQAGAKDRGRRHA
ncbi:RNA-guided endonuclease InsQ/TnpB family protein [Microvirga massiliensis]|uniref:RNA-guided endonuclease InsQ/TnpB family protein n=1 Tax=Microvirga massiliensis TaxID=1033741 RepID=UPI00065F7DCC|nr:RNA-guided endonuclease TnpB family protein [Microvirga massiliensis]